MGVPKRDRRRFPRHPELLNFSCIAWDVVQPAVSSDVSASGAFLALKHCPEEPSLVRLACAVGCTAPGAVQIVARVVRRVERPSAGEPRVGVGIEWLRAGCRNEPAALERFVRKVGGNPLKIAQQVDKDGVTPLYFFDFPANAKREPAKPKSPHQRRSRPSFPARSSSSYSLTGANLVEDVVVTYPAGQGPRRRPDTGPQGEPASGPTTGPKSAPVDEPASGPTDVDAPAAPGAVSEPVEAGSSPQQVGPGSAVTRPLFAVRLAWRKEDILGWATRVGDLAVDVVTFEAPPDTYERVTLLMQSSSGKSSRVVELETTVVSVAIQKATERGPLTELALQLTTRNKPDALHAFREVVKQVKAAAAA